MAVYKFSTNSLKTPLKYSSFLAGNSTFVPQTAFDSISTVTVGSGGASTVTFSSIPSNYTHLQLRVLARCTATSAIRNMTFQVNGDTASNYYRHYMQGDGTSVVAGADGGTVIYLGSASGTANGVSRFATSIYDFLDYADTNKFKTVRATYGFEDNSSGQAIFGSAHWRSTSAITSLTFSTEGSFAFSEYTSFALYGIKAA